MYFIEKTSSIKSVLKLLEITCKTLSVRNIPSFVKVSSNQNPLSHSHPNQNFEHPTQTTHALFIKFMPTEWN